MLNDVVCHLLEVVGGGASATITTVPVRLRLQFNRPRQVPVSMCVCVLLQSARVFGTVPDCIWNPARSMAVCFAFVPIVEDGLKLGAG